MIIFLLYTMVAWLANAGLVKIIYISIQPGQWLDKLLNWQQRLQKWDMQGRVFYAKAGGYCELCFSHVLTFAGFWLYVVFMNEVVGYWISAPVEGLLASIFVNFTWYLAYISIGTNLSLYFITKLFER